MQRIFYRIISGLLLWCCFSWALADTVPADFSTITVPVPSQSPADLHPALVNAFSQVLIKISGNSTIAAAPGIQQQLDNVEKFVQKYTYTGANVQVSFDQHALINLLAQAQQPIWLSARPATLIWLSINGQPPLTATSADNPSLLFLQNDASNRAISINFPTMDSSDQAIWQTKIAGADLDQAALQKIADHYQTPAILYGQMAQAADQSWTANWFLVWRNQTWQWRNTGAQAAVLQEGIDKLTDLMAAQLAINLNQQNANNMWLAVLGINNLTDYDLALRSLKQLQPVLGVTVQDVGSHGILVQITTAGAGTEAVKQALAGSPHFVPNPSDANAVTTTDVLQYRWVS